MTKKLDIFGSNSSLEIVNLGDASLCFDKTFTLIDQCLISKYQIIVYNVRATPFNSDYFLTISEANLLLKSDSYNMITTGNF